jgi:hypothetical protein
VHHNKLGWFYDGGLQRSTKDWWIPVMKLAPVCRQMWGVAFVACIFLINQQCPRSDRISGRKRHNVAFYRSLYGEYS